ncbi:S8 family serine peptidase [Streptomyces sp. NPDC047880]|uniref:S8 family serine peptidase n=1 Tax=Streptomyces sp. NPDC047880 TaxID=3155626 RepID=UPI0034539763
MPSVETTPSPKQPARPPPGDQHGTHIAGIIGGWWPELDFRGICPRIRLYDVRVLDDDGGGDEFSIVTALQAIRHINEQARRFIIAGVSISLSVPHDVASHSTGWTPVCVECDRLARSGVVVVTAAGNSGFTGTARTMGADYRDISISDPGNAESVITVGSTHRSNPHRHGVSYFSSRGPTGDGRPKPGLVAPGEDIDGPIPGEGIAAMHGTSQAAAHVSGAAAMLLLARNRELLGPPRNVSSSSPPTSRRTAPTPCAAAARPSPNNRPATAVISPSSRPCSTASTRACAVPWSTAVVAGRGGPGGVPPGAASGRPVIAAPAAAMTFRSRTARTALSRLSLADRR